MLDISPDVMIALEEQAWEATLRTAALVLAEQSARDLRLSAALDELGGAEVGRRIADAVAAARMARFADVDDVVALARLIVVHGDRVSRAPLSSETLSPLEMIALMEQFATDLSPAPPGGRP